MFNMFPYLNLHKINLDYIIKTVDQAVSTVQQSVERIEAALGTVNGLTARVEALETATQQLSTSVGTLSTSVETLDTRVNGTYRRIEALETSVQDVDERVSGLNRRITTMADDVAGKARLPIIINLSADAFPAQIPAADQEQVLAARTALNTGTGAAQAHIEQQVDQNLPAAFNIRLSYVGDGILTGILSQTIYDGNAQEYLSQITTVSINSSAMTWEMGSQTVKPGMEYMLRYNLQTLTPEAKRQARANIGAASSTELQALATSVQQLTGTTPTINAPANNTRYTAGELEELTLATAPASIGYSIEFTSGATPTVTMFPAAIRGLETFAAEANTTYEINILDNRAVVGSWAVTT